MMSPEQRRAEEKRKAVERYEAAQRKAKRGKSDAAKAAGKLKANFPKAPDPVSAAAESPVAEPTQSVGDTGDTEAQPERRHKPMRLVGAVAVVAMLVTAYFVLAPSYIERGQNSVVPHDPYEISDRVAAFHENLLVADMHAGTLLWRRDPLDRSNRGHVDLPRLVAGNVAVQVFGVVTKVPEGVNYKRNSADSDTITLLAATQLWPPATWKSLRERALYQAERLYDAAERSNGTLRVVTTRGQLEQALTDRSNGQNVTAGILSFEGAHVLEGDIANVQVLFDAGYRIMSLQHFFDNRLGGSLHGEDKGGLTPFGREAVVAMLKAGAIIDVTHSSEAVVRDVLKISRRPLVLSHTGLRGICDSPNNISDRLVRVIGGRGGLIGVGFWDAAACDISPEGIAKSLRYAVRLVGIDHVALGSDFDGSKTTTFDSSELAALTQAMADAHFRGYEIRLIMGGNLTNFLLQYLPK